MGVSFNENIERLEQAKADIKEAIENKGVEVGDGLIDTYADKIRQIKERGQMQRKSVSLERNHQSMMVEPDEGYSGLDSVWVSAHIPLESEFKTLYDNGRYRFEPKENYDGFQIVDVEVAVPIEQGRTVKIEQNGKTLIVPQEPYKALENVEIDVDVKFEGKQKLPNGMTLSGSTFEVFDMNQWDWTYVYDWSDMFCACGRLQNITFPTNQKIKVLDATCMFYSTLCREYDLTSFDFSECYSMKEMFKSCLIINTIRMSGSVDKLEDTTEIFNNTSENGFFYYDSRYDYSKIIEVLPSNWEAIPY